MNILEIHHEPMKEESELNPRILGEGVYRLTPIKEEGQH